MSDSIRMIREDVQKATRNKVAYDALASAHLAVTGGTGFLGTWLAETVAVLNDEYNLGITLHLYGRHTEKWAAAHTHLSSRDDIILHRQDVRSAFEFDPHTTHVVHAAGIPDNRMHASDPLRVFETTVYGTHNSLEAATKLSALRRFVHISSGLVEDNAGEAGKIHRVYVDAKRAAETLCSIYRSQHRLPMVTVRPFTFIGPYQLLDRPWAVNNFMRDSLTGNEIRIHGTGDTKRSYLYGSDAAAWLLQMAARGEDGAIYPLGSPQPVALAALAERVAAKVNPSPSITLRTLPNAAGRDFIPDMAKTSKALGLVESCDLHTAIDHTLAWHRANSL